MQIAFNKEARVENYKQTNRFYFKPNYMTKHVVYKFKPENIPYINCVFKVVLLNLQTDIQTHQFNINHTYICCLFIKVVCILYYLRGDNSMTCITCAYHLLPLQQARHV